MQQASEIEDVVRQAARDAGFELAGIAPVRELPELAHFPPWIAAGRAGEMQYLEARDEAGHLKRASLRHVAPWARSVIVCAINYNTAEPYSTKFTDSDRGWISRYAWSREDYHDTVMRKLRAVEHKLREAVMALVACANPSADGSTAGARLLARWGSEHVSPSEASTTSKAHDLLAAQPPALSEFSHGEGKSKAPALSEFSHREDESRGRQKLAPRFSAGNAPPQPNESPSGDDTNRPASGLITRCYVDTGPLVERVYAKYAGVGWIGKNTCILNQKLGSWLFLGVILTSLDLAPDLPAPDRCGKCTRCIDACPTDALIAPYQLDSNLCISYLTIEKRGEIPESMRAGLGRHVFGCDICQDVCPWNRKAPATSAEEFQPREGLVNPALAWLAEMSVEEFRERFRGSPVRRAKRNGLRRNAILAMGNSGDRTFLPLLQKLTEDEDEVIVESARWAAKRLED
ncbi:MAG TPA: tRNA epoxyqueuosine(34) reductase QueG [Ktedonobacterales bacterium]|nr:tRNA epoxyqueuosine(34) reductase QueG [Ktedonobacterales bacterium]